MNEEYSVDGWNNFCRIFEMPAKFSNEYCFGGGIDTNFKMVDWFYPIGGLDAPAISKEAWKVRVGDYESKKITLTGLRDNLAPFILNKAYIKKGREYLFLSNFGASFILKAE